MTINRVVLKTFVGETEEHGVSFGIEVQDGYARAWIQETPEEKPRYSASYEVDKEPELIIEKDE